MALRDWTNFDFLCWRLSERPRRFVVLVRHFFIRFFQNDVFPFEDQMKEKLYVVLAMLAPLGWVLASSLYGPYIFNADNGESWFEKCILVSFFMVLMIFITLLEWDVLFIDRRDYANLAGLPVKPKTVFRAKFVSLLFFVALYAAAVNSLSGIATGFFLPQWIGNSLGSFFLYQAGHWVSLTLSFYFSFFLILALEAVLLLLLGPRVFRSVSLVVRFLLATVCFAFLILYLVDHATLARIFEQVAEWRVNNRPLFLAVPPVWFTAIYEKIIGRVSFLYDIAAMRGVVALIGLGLFAYFALGLSYRKHMRKSLEVSTRRRLFQSVGEQLQRIFDGLVLRHPVERAVFHYFGRTLKTSPRLKVRIAGMMAVAVGFLFVLVLGTKTLPVSAETAGLNILAIPLVLAIALLLAFRSGVNIPLTAEANWIFRLTEAPTKRSYFVALKKAVFCFGLLPLFLVMFGIYALLWGPGPAAVHTLFGLICSFYFREVLFWRYAKIPFSCLVVPGKAKVHYFWLLYFVAFLLTVSILCTVERALFLHPSAFPIFFGATIALLFGISLYQRLFIYEKLQIIYEEEPEPVMVTL
ncbi:MAG: hypothetical protein NTW38_04100 [Candidatus Aminicenantes bacterium]|nr:hypothetical protein [Candidatus Aminicenantes bacterium]